MKAILLGLVMLAVLMPLAQADMYERWEAVCIGNVLIENTTLTVDTDIIPVERNMTCPYGCDSGRRQCYDYSGPPGAAIPGELFLLFEVFAFMMFFGSFLLDDPIRKMIFALVGVILFFPMGLLSLNVLFSGMAMSMTWLAWLNWVFGALCMAIFIYGLLLMFKELKHSD